MTKKEITKSLCGYPAALNVKETAQILRVSTKLIYRMIREKKLPATKVGREKRIAFDCFCNQFSDKFDVKVSKALLAAN